MKFNYQARTKTGETQSGVIEAASKEAAVSLLQKTRLFVTFLEEAEAAPFYAKKIKLFGKVSKKDVVNFSRQLSIMFQSDIPLVESLRALADQIKNPNFKEKILALSEEVAGGTPFSLALSHYPKLFSAFYVNMVKSGEASGTLSKGLNFLADHLEREYYLNSKIRGAMIYPALIVVMVIGVLIMMVYFIIPNLSTILTTSGQELPFITKAVLSFSDFARSSGMILFLIVLTILIFFAFRYLKTPKGKKILDKSLLKIPIFGSFLKKMYLSRFAENLSTLFSGGLPIAKSLEITGEVVNNNIYRTIIFETAEKVRRGEKISKILSGHSGEFPPMIIQMIAVGEKTGKLGESLMNSVEFYRKEVDRAVDSLLSIMEPLLIIFLGGIVAGLMAAILMPLYQMTAI